jgi:hypothetical protein
VERHRLVSNCRDGDCLNCLLGLIGPTEKLNGFYLPCSIFLGKMLIFDEYMVSIGSTNFDVRSFELNDEASLNVYDSSFAR